MSALPPLEKCKWCGEEVPRGADRCPACGRPAALPGPLDLQEDRPQVAFGQQPFGSWASIKEIAHGDKLFTAVLLLMALDVAVAALGGGSVSVLLAIARLWGVLTFRWWGYWLAMIGAGLGALLWLPIFLAAASTGGATGALWILPFLFDCFVLYVLHTRRDSFD
jgi:hypothetical protein